MFENEMYSLGNYTRYRKLVSLPPSSKFILYLLKRLGPLALKDIVRKSLLPKRTVVFSLKRLSEDEFVRKLTHEKDKRIRLYETLI
jgi:DNA-binding MarR family transcriptional regulator